MRMRPIRSVLANRKMFQGGGMVPVGNQMQNMQPMGILASSQPLVDAVTRDAINPMGGPTLSMAEGGIAKFQEGGLGRFSPEIQESIRVPSLTYGRQEPTADYSNWLDVAKQVINPDELLPVPQTESLRRLRDEKVGDAVNRIFPLKSFPGQEDFDKSFEGGIPDNLSRAEKFGSRVAGYLHKTAERLDSNLEQTMQSLNQWMHDSGVSNRSLAEVRTIVRLQASRPDLADEIRAIGLRLLEAKGPDDHYDIKERSLTQQSLEGMSDNPLARDIVEELKRGERVTYRPVVQEIIEEVGPFQRRLDTIAAENLMRDQAENFQRIIKPQGTGTQSVQEAEEAALLKNQRRMQEGQIGNVIPRPVEKPGVLPTAREEDDLSLKIIQDEIDLKESEANYEKEYGRQEDILFDQIIRDSQETSQETSQKASIREEGWRENQARQNAAAQVRDTFRKDTSDDQLDAQALLKKYIEEFRSAVPGYEGKSEWEKGMDIVKMGMAIAAGESPNAITNIAKGVMATIDNFTSDDKERRAYERQVGLSAGKYALDSVARDEAKADALAKELRGDKLFTVMKDSVIDGRKYDAGSLYRMSVGDMRDGKLAELSGVLTTEGNYSRLLQHKVDMEKLMQKLGPQIVGSGDGAPSQNNLDTSLSDYRELIKNSKNDVLMMTMLDSSIITNAQGKVTGVGSWFSRKVNSLANSVNLKGQLGALDKLAEEGLESKEYLYKQQVIANMMLKEILGEGSKNVSNIDRDLAQQIVGMLSEWDTIWADKDLLHEKLQHIRSITQSSLNTNLNGMSDLEFGWTNVVNRAGQGVSQRMERARGEFAKEVGLLQEPSELRQAEEGIVPKPIVLNVWDFIDQDTGRIKKDRPGMS